jgi:hypothetical protein
MKRLSGIFRSGGYPITAESLDAIGSNELIFERAIQGLTNLPFEQKKAVILMGEIMCFVDGGNYKLVGVNRGTISTNSLINNPGMYALIDASYYVNTSNNSGSSTFENTILIEQYNVVNAANAGVEGWVFVKYKDLNIEIDDPCLIWKETIDPSILSLYNCKFRLDTLWRILDISLNVIFVGNGYDFSDGNNSISIDLNYYAKIYELNANNEPLLNCCIYAPGQLGAKKMMPCYLTMAGIKIDNNNVPITGVQSININGRILL